MNSTPLKIRFQESEKFIDAYGKKIEIRAFLFENNDGMKILSNEPNLKTCCVGTKDKREKQILIIGNLETPKTQNAQTFQGYLYLNDPNEITQSMPMYKMEYPVIVPDPKNNLSVPGLIILSCIFIIILITKLTKNHPT